MLLQNDELKAALGPYTLEGPHGRLLDADHDDLALSDIVCFEMEDLMGSADAVAPVVTYLFHRLEERFDGKPAIVILDEAWLFLDDPLFAARIREWLKTLRKKNVAVIFATQSLTDVANSAIAHERAVEPQQFEIYERFGLNPRQIEIISQSTPQRDYYFQSPLGARVFELGLGPVTLAFCGASGPDDQKLIDETVAANSEAFAAAFLAAKNLNWAADLLNEWPGAAPAQMMAAE